MVELKPLLSHMRTDLLIQVHDELIFDMPYDEVFMIPKIVSIMENFRLRVPIEVEVEWSDQSWGHKKPWEGEFEWKQ